MKSYLAASRAPPCDSEIISGNFMGATRGIEIISGSFTSNHSISRQKMRTDTILDTTPYDKILDIGNMGRSSQQADYRRIRPLSMFCFMFAVPFGLIGCCSQSCCKVLPLRRFSGGVKRRRQAPSLCAWGSVMYSRPTLSRRSRRADLSKGALVNQAELRPARIRMLPFPPIPMELSPFGAD